MQLLLYSYTQNKFISIMLNEISFHKLYLTQINFQSFVLVFLIVEEFSCSAHSLNNSCLSLIMNYVL